MVSHHTQVGTTPSGKDSIVLSFDMWALADDRCKFLAHEVKLVKCFSKEGKESLLLIDKKVLRRELQLDSAKKKKKKQIMTIHVARAL